MSRKPAFEALILSLPMAALFAGYWLIHAPGLQPTGFIQYDNAGYTAYARQYLDSEGLNLFYSNPFNDGPGYAPVYFQIQTVLLAGVMALGLAPGVALTLFTLVCTWGTFRVLIRLYDFLLPERPFRTLHLWILCWGGGLLVAGGAAVQWLGLHQPTDAFNGLFILDPGNGWWGLSLGRALVFSCEAWYHLLFLGTFTAFVLQRWKTGLLLLLALSLSHPFTGLEAACIAVLFSLVETFRRERTVPRYLLAVSLAVLGLHLFYYLYWLPQHADHASVMQQYTLKWRLRFFNMIPAYAFCGALAAATLRMQRGEFFNRQHNRLLLCWAAGAFLLANHELFTEARQPIHFTRGYIWTALMLLGLPALQALHQHVKRKWGKGALALLLALWLTDNTLWIVNYVRSYETAPDIGHLDAEWNGVLRVADSLSDEKTLLVATHTDLAYLATVYTAAYPWYSHIFTTPFIPRKASALEAFHRTGLPDTAWQGRPVVILWTRNRGDTAQAERPLAPGLRPVQKIGNTEIYFTPALRLP